MILRLCLPLSFAFYFIALVLHGVLVGGDADFESVRIHSEYKDMSGRGGDPKAKYWRKSNVLCVKFFALTKSCIQMNPCKFSALLI